MNVDHRDLLHDLINRSGLQTVDAIISHISLQIADIDDQINTQINTIMQQPAFKQLEASWRGLNYLVQNSPYHRLVRIRLLDISWGEIVRDIAKATEFDQSQLFDKLYSQEFGQAGGEPYGVLLGDFAISHRQPQDLPTLRGLSQICASAFVPFIAAAHSDFFGLDNFADLNETLDLEAIFSQSQYQDWQKLRQFPESRFIGLTLPRVIMRSPYQTQAGNYKGVYLHDVAEGFVHQDYLWGNACYAFGEVLLREFASVGWFGHIRGVPQHFAGGGIVTHLAHAQPGQDNNPSTEVIINDTFERQLSDAGFLPLSHCYMTTFAAFYNNQSIQKPVVKRESQNLTPTHRQQETQHHLNQKLSSMLQHVLCVSRIAHYIKIMVREKVGSFKTAEDCEHFLREWLFRYTTGREDLDWDEQARYPLRRSAVEVWQHAQKPGVYLSKILLQPHYQIDQITAQVELTTELAMPTVTSR